MPPGRLHEDDSTPLSMSCSKMMGSHFFHQRLPITGLQSLHHDFWRWEHGRRIKKTTRESSTSSSPWRPTTGMDRKGLGVLLSPSLDLLYTMKLLLKWKVLLPLSTGSICGCRHKVKLFCFNLHFIVLVSERNMKYNIVSSLFCCFCCCIIGFFRKGKF